MKNRYASWDSGIGAKIESGKAGFKELEAYMLKKGEADAERQRPPGIPGKPHQRVYLKQSLNAGRAGSPLPAGAHGVTRPTKHILKL